MARLLHYLLVLLSFSSLVLASPPPQANFKANKLVLQVHIDSPTNLHVANVHTPLLQVPFLVNLQGKFLWVNCDQQYLTSTYHAPYCHSTQCSKANSHTCHTCPYTARPGCHNNTCGLMVENPVTHQSAMGELAQDELLIQSTQGSNPGPMARVPQFLFTCAPSFLLQNGNGVIFFGDGPYYMHPGIDISHPLSYTPLTVSQKGEYYIQESSIKVNNKLVPLDTSLLSFKQHGLGGAMISTTTPYTILEHSIFTTVTQFFSKELSGVPQTKPVAPFGVCYESNKITSSRLGPGVPNIDLVLHTQNVIWRIFGANLMVQAHLGVTVTCLGFVDGGSHPKASIVIGAYQLEDNLLQFDLAKSRLGLSSSLKSRRTNCANFNFTSSP
uniref:Peptidase A1 domain-containing protein n=1 Tax=Quercus lobata TaxID=97700 RepID=A0A7N2L426_QUELO